MMEPLGSPILQIPALVDNNYLTGPADKTHASEGKDNPTVFFSLLQGLQSLDLQANDREEEAVNPLARFDLDEEEMPLHKSIPVGAGHAPPLQASAQKGDGQVATLNPVTIDNISGNFRFLYDDSDETFMSLQLTKDDAPPSYGEQGKNQQDKNVLPLDRQGFLTLQKVFLSETPMALVATTEHEKLVSFSASNPANLQANNGKEDLSRELEGSKTIISPQAARVTVKPEDIGETEHNARTTTNLEEIWKRDSSVEEDLVSIQKGDGQTTSERSEVVDSEPFPLTNLANLQDNNEKINTVDPLARFEHEKGTKKSDKIMPDYFVPSASSPPSQLNELTADTSLKTVTNLLPHEPEESPLEELPIDDVKIHSDDGHSEIRIDFNSDSSDLLKVEVSVKEGTVKADILTNTLELKQTIETNLDQLINSLLNHGLSMEEFSVMVGFNHGKEAGKEQVPLFPSKGVRETEESPKEGVKSYMKSAGSGLVDLFI